MMNTSIIILLSQPQRQHNINTTKYNVIIINKQDHNKDINNNNKIKYNNHSSSLKKCQLSFNWP